MTIPATDVASLTGYQLRLPAFEGPLDVLLRLIERNQLTIADVSLVTVTEQFIEHISTLEATDSAVIAEFTAVAARLLVLKSRSLLPRPPAPDDEVESSLTHELLEHRAMHAAMAQLRELDAGARAAFPIASPDLSELTGNAPLRLAPHQPSQLVAALRRRLTVSRPAPAPVAMAPVISLEQIVERILGIFTRRRLTTFATLTQPCRDLSEVRATFIGLLLLARRRVVEAEQETLYGPINIHRLNDAADTDGVLHRLVLADDPMGADA